jgi:hypothetical protein
MAEQGSARDTNDADDLARVAALVARAGLRLPADEIAGLVTAYQSDRAGFERLRRVVAAEDEPAHVFRSARADQADGRVS